MDHNEQWLQDEAYLEGLHDAYVEQRSFILPDYVEIETPFGAIIVHEDAAKIVQELLLEAVE